MGELDAFIHCVNETDVSCGNDVLRFPSSFPQNGIIGNISALYPRTFEMCTYMIIIV